MSNKEDNLENSMTPAIVLTDASAKADESSASGDVPEITNEENKLEISDVASSSITPVIMLTDASAKTDESSVSDDVPEITNEENKLEISDVASSSITPVIVLTDASAKDDKPSGSDGVPKTPIQQNEKKEPKGKSEDKEEPSTQLGTHLTKETLATLKKQSQGCYSLVFGFTNHGKSACLDIVSKCFFEANHVDKKSTPRDSINTIVIENENKESVYLVDVAGENIISWLVHTAKMNEHDITAYFIADDAPEQEDDLSNVKKNIPEFDALIDGATCIYILIPAKKHEDWTAKVTVDQCVRLLKGHIGSKKITILITHMDLAAGVKVNGREENTKVHYCYIDNTDFLIQDKTSSQILEDLNNNTLPLFNVNRLNQLTSNYIQLVHGSNGNMSERCEYSAGNGKYFLNKLVTYSDDRPNFSYMYLLYPVTMLLQRRYDEVQNNDLKNVVIPPMALNNGLAIEPNPEYIAAEKEFKETIRKAFHLEVMNCPIWLDELDELKKANKIIEDNNTEITELTNSNEKKQKELLEYPKQLLKKLAIAAIISLSFLAMYWNTNKGYVLPEHFTAYIQYKVDEDVDPYFKISPSDKFKILQYLVKNYEKGPQEELKTPQGTPLATQTATQNKTCNTTLAANSGRLTTFQQLTTNLYSGDDRGLGESIINSKELEAFKTEVKSKFTLTVGNETDQCIDILRELWIVRVGLNGLTYSNDKLTQEALKTQLEKIKFLYEFIMALDPQLLGYANLKNDYNRDMPLINSILRDLSLSKTNPVVELLSSNEILDPSETKDPKYPLLVMGAVKAEAIPKSTDSSPEGLINNNLGLQDGFDKEPLNIIKAAIANSDDYQKAVDKFCGKPNAQCKQDKIPRPSMSILLASLLFAIIIVVFGLGFWWFKRVKDGELQKSINKNEDKIKERQNSSDEQLKKACTIIGRSGALFTLNNLIAALEEKQQRYNSVCKPAPKDNVNA